MFADIESDCKVLPMIADHLLSLQRPEFITEISKRYNAVSLEAAEGRTFLFKLE